MIIKLIKHIRILLLIGLIWSNSKIDSIKTKKLSHKQYMSMGLHYFNGMSISSYSYNNKFKYHFYQNLIADINISGNYIMNPYYTMWKSEIFNKGFIAIDAGISYYPFNNGIFNLDARTYHDQLSRNQQTINIEIFGIPIKNIYNSASYKRKNNPIYENTLNVNN